MADSSSGQFRIFGSELSPYSVKVRSYFRYKGIAHEWIIRSPSNQEEFQKYARLPIVPAVATPEDEGLQDSTPIIEALESRFPEPSIHPSDTALRFLSELLEEFGDEWGNKWMFHYRWARPVDQSSAAERIASEAAPGVEGEALAAVVEQIRERMNGRGFAVGSNEQTAPIIEQSFQDGVAVLERHLQDRPYVMGARPAFADFGLWGQIFNAWTDPTPGAILKASAPATCAWIDRMRDPKAQGDFETWETLAPTLAPFLKEQVRLFLIWSDANAKAIAEKAEHLSVDLEGRAWSQSVGGPQKYHAKSLAVLRRKYGEVADDPALNVILEESGCREWLG